MILCTRYIPGSSNTKVYFTRCSGSIIKKIYYIVSMVLKPVGSLRGLNDILILQSFKRPFTSP